MSITYNVQNEEISYSDDSDDDDDHDDDDEMEEIRKKSSSQKSNSLSSPCPKFFSIGATAVVIDCIDQLSISTNVFEKDVEDEESKSLYYQTIRERFDSKIRKKFDNFKINSKFTNLHKIQKEMLAAVITLKLLAEELLKDGTYDAVIKYDYCIKRLEKEENELIVQKCGKERMLKYLRYVYQKEKKQIRSLKGEMRNEIRKLNDEMEIMQYFANEEIKYTKDWEDSRNYQNDYKLSLKEEVLHSAVNVLYTKLNIEDRCHTEFTNFIEESKQELMIEIQKWIKIYEEKIEEMDGKVLNLKMDQEQLIETRQNLKEQMATRQIEIDIWLEKKRKIREEEERIERELRSAIKIQAWWRETMVRRKLGPYRKKKRGAKGKGKDKGKGKGKGKKK